MRQHLRQAAQADIGPTNKEVLQAPTAACRSGGETDRSAEAEHVLRHGLRSLRLGRDGRQALV